MTAGAPGIDWEAVRRALAERGRRLEEANAGRGAFADELLRRRTEMLAKPPPTAVDAPPAGRLLIVRGVAARYALPIACVRRVIAVPPVTPVPGAAPELLGIVAVAGRVIRLLDLDRLCGETGAADPRAGAAVVLRLSGRSGALRVLAADAVVDAAAAAGERLSPYLSGVTADRVALVDPDALARRLEKTETP